MTQTRIFDEFKGEHIPYLEWSFFSNEEDIIECKKFYSLSDDYQIIATDICGNIITIKDESIVIVDHEQSDSDNNYKKTDELDALLILLRKLITVEDYIEADDIDVLKKIKNDLKECKKLAPKKMKDDFKDFIDDVKQEIEFLE